MSGPDAYEFIRTCLSHRPAASRRKAARAFFETSIDWEIVCQEARRHRVLPLFFHTLEELLGTDLPSTIHEQIREHQRGVRIQNTFVVQELDEVVRQFEGAGLPLLVTKGPVLAQTAYGDVALRQSVDVDVAIPEDQFAQADRLLRGLGYKYAEKRKRLHGWRKSFSRYLDGQWEFTRGAAFTLDVHTRLMPPGFSFPSDFHQFWERARPVQLTDEVRVQGLSREDQVLVLAYHGIKNQWRALRHVVDIASVIRSEGPLDWDLLLSRTRTMSTTRPLKLGLCMCHNLLDVTLPSHVKEWSLESSMHGIAVSMKSYLQDRASRSALPYRERVWLQLATKDTLAGQLRYIAYSFLRHVWSKLLQPRAYNS